MDKGTECQWRPLTNENWKTIAIETHRQERQKATCCYAPNLQATVDY
jgi:hypothetical protein